MRVVRRMDIGSFTMTTKTKPLTDLQAWFNSGFRRAANDPAIIVPIIRRFGYHTKRNFVQEMWPGGGQDWARLTPYTQDEREERGYDPEHPILVQSGQLKRLATEPFQNWRSTQRSIRPRTEIAPYGDETPLSLTASLRPGRFETTMSGERVKHQTAYQVSRRDGSRVGVPPRPFWGITREMIDEGVSGRGESVVNQYGTTRSYETAGSLRTFLMKWYEQRK